VLLGDIPQLSDMSFADDNIAQAPEVDVGGELEDVDMIKEKDSTLNIF
jgi:hypothetical protein